MLTLKNISFTHANKKLFDEVNLQIKKGSLIALIGKNGSGKSTFLNLLSNNLHTKSNQIIWENKSYKAYTRIQLSKIVSLVLTSFQIDSELLVIEILESARAPYTGFFGTLRNPDNKIIREIINEFSLEKLIHRKFSTCSDGEKQRVLIATAFIKETRLILLDEPTAFMDLNYKIEFYKLLQKKQREKIIIFSTHDIEMALQLSNKFLVIHNKTISLYSKEELINQNILNKVFNHAIFNTEGRIIL